MARWNPAILDKYVAPGISVFTDANIPDLSPLFPQARYWLVNHFLNTTLRASFKDRYRQVVIAFLRRTQNAFTDYCTARQATLDYLADNDPLNPKVGPYYIAVTAWEHFVLQAAIAIGLFKWLNRGMGAFTKNDGSKEERLYSIANNIKHTSSCVDSGQCKECHTLPLWLTNDEMVSFGKSISYVEASEVLVDLAKMADEYQDPYAFKRQPTDESKE